MAQVQTERLGVAGLDYFFSEHGWLFREQPTHDYGVDAHAEIVVDKRPTGKLIAIQIKAGLSFFSEETEDAYIFRTDEKHVAYWVGHSMPVVVVLFNPDTKQAARHHLLSVSAFLPSTRCCMRIALALSIEPGQPTRKPPEGTRMKRKP